MELHAFIDDKSDTLVIDVGIDLFGIVMHQILQVAGD